MLHAGQDVYFHVNHPIKWVRICGVVVSVDERETKHFYMIDDGSGATLECVVNVTPGAAPRTTAARVAAAAATADPKSNVHTDTRPVFDAPIDVGHILDIKGSVSTWRNNRQIRAERIVHLHSTEKELMFWEKVTLLKRDVLSKPWVLDRREVRRCKREEEGRSTSGRHRGTGERHRSRRVEKTAVEAVKTGFPKTNTKTEGTKTGLEKTKTGLERTKTGLERSRSGLERTTTALERTKTGLERAIIKPERSKTGLEKVATGREKTRTGLERTTTGLENMRTGLEKMKTPFVEETPNGQERSDGNSGHERKPLARRPVTVTGLEKRRTAKPVTRLIPVTGKYDALGL